MSGMPQNGNGNDPTTLVVIVVGLMGAALFAFTHFREDLFQILIRFSRLELLPVGFFSSEAAYVRYKLSGLDPATLTGAQIMAQLNYAGKYYSYLMVPVYAALAWLTWDLSVADRFRRKLTMRKLLRNNLRNNPCIAPIVNWPRSILEESSDVGYWAVARQPIQLAARHGLLKHPDGSPVPPAKLLGADHLANMESELQQCRKSPLRFDRDEAAGLLKSQLGQPFTTADAMAPYLRKLAVAFVLFGTGKKKEGQAILDEMSMSFRAPSEGRKGVTLTCRFPFVLPPEKPHGFILNMCCPYDLKKMLEGIPHVVAHHASYECMIVLALYRFARKKGVLPTSEFIWLRPVDRRMFYLLNNEGRRTAWPEIAGAWAHFMAEEKAGISIGEPQVLEGVNALELAIYEEGWIDSLSAEAQKNLVEK